MKFLKYIFLLVIIGFMTNCSDLEEETFTFFSPNNFYTNAEDLNNSVTGVYDGFQGFFNDNQGYNMILEVVTKYYSPGYVGGKSDNTDYNVWRNPNNDELTVNIWGSCYSIINKVNVVLERGADIKMDQALKERRFAEARFIRAICYYYLVRVYGGCAIPEGMTKGLEGLEIPRKSVDETYDYIIADLEYCISKLPVKSAYGDADKWRATKGAAQGLLGEVYLTRGSMTGRSDYFTKSKQYSGEVIQSGEYRLEPDFKDLWYWWNTKNKNGTESVFSVQYGAYAGETNSRHQMWGFTFTDQSTGQAMWRRTLPSIEHYLSYSDNDARKKGTFITKAYKTTDGKTIKDSIEFVAKDKGFMPGSKGWTAPGPGNVKHYDRSPESSSLGFARANEYLMRYADVLLNYAESENELNGPTANAYEKVNMVRNRAKLPDLKAGLSKQAFSDSLYKERGWEFVGEVQLYFDALRTDRLGYDVKVHVENGIAQGIYGYIPPIKFYPKKDFLWKIPRYDMDSNPALEQNPDNVSKY